jgi:membrane fusion protein, heavy metal efflux system
MKLNSHLSLILIAGFLAGGCKHPQVEGGLTKKTFVMSDTMMKTIRIDTASLQPVQMEIHFSGKVAEKAGKVDILVDVAAANLGSVRKGYEAEVVTASLPDKVFYGTVDGVFISPSDTMTQTGQLSIKLDDDSKAIKPEMFTKVVLHCNEGDTMIAVPEAAVIEDHNRNFVLVFKNKYNVQVREVETYTTAGDVTYISKGLLAGENVISAHQQQIYDALSDD